MTVGIKDVARVAGVSPATVSRVLGNGPVSDDLRQKVEAAIKATQYRPNLAARRLRSQHSRTIGLIVSDIRNPFFTTLSRAVEDAAYGADMRVVLCNTDENPAREAMYLRMMQEERITGLIYAPTRTTAERLGRMEFGFPVVLVDRAGPLGMHDAVTIDNPLAAGLLVDHLVSQGHRRIAGLFGNTSSTAVLRHDGYAAAMARHGLEADACFLPPTAEAAESELTRRLEAGERPDAVMVSNSLLLLGLYRAARRAGLETPRDIAIAGFDNETWTELVGPGLTVIEQPVAEIGRAAMDLVFERLRTPEMARRQVVLAARLVVRGSSAARDTVCG
ncbi:LacI family DNA-binding transcriptional regulator [Blastochloris tepida]|uniref:LacI family transcriptional regulator n=1 Tax=Blastochloris tepida TaxID=2233851 RepID=A0A348FY06_9HYPH|nr:LacI family DNA-binding transcriptional regulator [Blastochloris tepida]BBF92189.1 LacI family transcriptional regulator [Blastochloris tepida]